MSLLAGIAFTLFLYLIAVLCLARHLRIVRITQTDPVTGEEKPLSLTYKSASRRHS
jgi:hypothetical protein